MSLTNKESSTVRSPRSVHYTHEQIRIKKEAALATFDVLHEEGFSFLADNSYIHTGYRLNYSLRQCAKSMFQLHNETLNVWTHTIGAGIFVILIIYMFLNGYQDSGFKSSNPITGIPECDLINVPYIADGQHTLRMFMETSVDPILRSTCSPVHTGFRKDYLVASVIFDHTLGRFTGLEKTHDLLEEHISTASSYVSDSFRYHINNVHEELSILQDHLNEIRDSGIEWLSHPTSVKISLLRDQLHERVLTFNEHLKRIAKKNEDYAVKFALEEYHNLMTNVEHGLEVLFKGREIYENSIHQVARWPLFVFLCSVVFTLFCSSLFHLMYVHSNSLYFFLSRLDYTGIAVMIAGSFFPLIYYSFYCHPWVLTGYLTSVTIMAIATSIVSLVPAFGTPKYIILRTLVFLALGGFGVVPISHLIWKFGLFDEHVTILLKPLLLMAFLYVFGAVIYSTRFPERFFPGRFDYWLSSHQLWHICVVAAAIVHYINAIQHYEWRWDTECQG